MVFVYRWLVLMITFFDNLPKHIILHSHAAEAGDISSSRIIIIIMHSMSYCEIGTLHSHTLCILIHKLIKSFKTFCNFYLQCCFLHRFVRFLLLLLLWLAFLRPVSCSRSFLLLAAIFFFFIFFFINFQNLLTTDLRRAIWGCWRWLLLLLIR